ncbi:MAG: S49 family peptidase [Chloroflexi bacterium]|nr:S49 family peptidase [Chloroflexota bacterium]
MAVRERLRRFWRTISGGPVAYVAVVVLALVVGYALFYYVGPGRPYVGVIRLPYVEIGGGSTVQMLEMLRFAERDNRIKAVAIDITSPGGPTADSEDLYNNVLRLRESKPVVFSVGWIAASGGYFMASAGDYIYARPSSMVGNVGAVLFAPGPLPADEDLIATGPFKLTGGTRRQYVSLLEIVKDAFVRSVYAQRGDRLKLAPDELADGRIYVGIEAVRLGLVDGLGSTNDAIEQAARLAGIRNYGTIDIVEEVRKTSGVFYFTAPSPAPPQATGGAVKPTAPESRYHRFYYLYVEPTK